MSTFKITRRSLALSLFALSQHASAGVLTWTNSSVPTNTTTQYSSTLSSGSAGTLLTSSNAPITETVVPVPASGPSGSGSQLLGTGVTPPLGTGAISSTQLSITPSASTGGNLSNASYVSGATYPPGATPLHTVALPSNYTDVIPSSWIPGLQTGTDNEVYTAWSGTECPMSQSSWNSHYMTVLMTIPRGTVRWQQKSIWKGMIPAATDLLTLYSNPTTTNPYTCCGGCWIAWNDVSVRYWPQAGYNTACLNSITNTRMQNAIQDDMALDTRKPQNTGWINVKREINTRASSDQPTETKTSWIPLVTPGPLVRRQNGTGNDTGPATMVGDDGFTYTSPYIYFEVPKVNAPNGCGYVGPQLTNVRISVMPERVSSIVPDEPEHWSCFFDYNRPGQVNDPDCVNFQIKPFNFGDLPCPPDSLRAWGKSSFIYDPAQPYDPIIVGQSITELQNLAPEYKTCGLNYAWDPFIALQPQTALVANPTKGPSQQAPVSAEPGHVSSAAPTPTPTPARNTAPLGEPGSQPQDPADPVDSTPTPKQTQQPETPDPPASTPINSPKPAQDTLTPSSQDTPAQQPSNNQDPSPSPSPADPQTPAESPSNNQDPSPSPSNPETPAESPSNNQDPSDQQDPAGQSDPAATLQTPNQPAASPNSPNSPEQGSPSPTDPPSIGSIINGAMGGSDTPVAIPAVSPTDRSFTANGQTVVINSQGTFVSGQKLTPGVAQTIGGETFSVPAAANDPSTTPQAGSEQQQGGSPQPTPGSPQAQGGAPNAQATTAPGSINQPSNPDDPLGQIVSSDTPNNVNTPGNSPSPNGNQQQPSAAAPKIVIGSSTFAIPEASPLATAGASENTPNMPGQSGQPGTPDQPGQPGQQNQPIQPAAPAVSLLTETHFDSNGQPTGTTTSTLQFVPDVAPNGATELPAATSTLLSTLYSSGKSVGVSTLTLTYNSAGAIITPASSPNPDSSSSSLSPAAPPAATSTLLSTLYSDGSSIGQTTLTQLYDSAGRVIPPTAPPGAQVVATSTLVSALYSDGSSVGQTTLTQLYDSTGGVIPLTAPLGAQVAATSTLLSTLYSDGSSIGQTTLTQLYDSTGGVIPPTAPSGAQAAATSTFESMFTSHGAVQSVAVTRTYDSAGAVITGSSGDDGGVDGTMVEIGGSTTAAGSGAGVEKGAGETGSGSAVETGGSGGGASASTSASESVGQGTVVLGGSGGQGGEPTETATGSAASGTGAADGGAGVVGLDWRLLGVFGVAWMLRDW